MPGIAESSRKRRWRRSSHRADSSPRLRIHQTLDPNVQRLHRETTRNYIILYHGILKIQVYQNDNISTVYVYYNCFFPGPRLLFRPFCGSRPKPRWCSPAHRRSAKSMVKVGILIPRSGRGPCKTLPCRGFVSWKKRAAVISIIVLHHCPKRCSRCRPWGDSFEECGVEVKDVKVCKMVESV